MDDSVLKIYGRVRIIEVDENGDEHIKHECFNKMMPYAINSILSYLYSTSEGSVAKVPSAPSLTTTYLNITNGSVPNNPDSTITSANDGSTYSAGVNFNSTSIYRSARFDGYTGIISIIATFTSANAAQLPQGIKSVGIAHYAGSIYSFLNRVVLATPYIMSSTRDTKIQYDIIIEG